MLTKSQIRVILEDALKNPGLEYHSGDPEIYNQDRKSTRLNSSHIEESRMPSSA